MRDKEAMRLRNFAKALMEGNRKNAMRICRNMLKDPTHPLIHGKRQVWTYWHEQLKQPDPVGGRREILAIVMSNPLTKVDYLRIMDEYEARAKRLSLEYHYNFLNGQLLRLAFESRMLHRKWDSGH